jgi:hypothetical protein
VEEVAEVSEMVVGESKVPKAKSPWGGAKVVLQRAMGKVADSPNVGMDCMGLRVVDCFWCGCRWMEVVQSLRLVAMDSPGRCARAYLYTTPYSHEHTRTMTPRALRRELATICMIALEYYK